MEFESVIGIEIHAQLNTDAKIFCTCASRFGGSPNTRVCPVCLGMPGTLPVLNRRVVDMTILAGLAMNCSVAGKSIFARKNYFYADLPKGYQITQYDLPICENGAVTVHVDGTTRRIGIARIHIEEDPGKMIHDQDVDSLLDYNRCGTPLIEIVTEPDIRSAEEAAVFGHRVRQLLQYTGVCDCNMEQGNMRFDVNLSIRPGGEKKLGTRTEVKNLNSFSALHKAVEYEYRRQKDLLLSGGRVIQETLEWNAQKNVTYTLRSKEDAQDYRYFPEPDLVPLVVDDDWVEGIREAMPELPDARSSRFRSEYDLTEEHALVLTDSRSLADYYEEVVAECGDPGAAANWVMGETLRLAKERKVEVGQLRVTPSRLGALIRLVTDGTVSANAGKKVLDGIEEHDRDPEGIVDQLGLRQISDTSALHEAVIRVLEENPDEVQRYKDGEKKLIGFLIGRAMRMTGGKGNPVEFGRLFAEELR